MRRYMTWESTDDLIDEPSQDTTTTPRVLVAVINSPRDYAIVRDVGWYRIPVKRAPTQIGADYLAFYHTAAFAPDMRWCVRYYAPVRDYRLVTRAELLPTEADHPRAAERYYRIDIGSLLELPTPIFSRRLRRITFISTTLERLLAAHEINDLWETSDAKERLWNAFREASIGAERHYPIGEGHEAYIADFAIPCGDPVHGPVQSGGVAILVDGRRVVEVPGWVVLHFSERQISDHTASCLDLVREAMRARTGA
jgi:hypothetical protein